MKTIKQNWQLGSVSDNAKIYFKNNIESKLILVKVKNGMRFTYENTKSGIKQIDFKLT